MLVVGLDELLVLLLDLLGVLAGRAEQQLLQVAEEVLPGLRGDLPVGDVGLQVAGERGCSRGGGRQRAGVRRLRLTGLSVFVPRGQLAWLAARPVGGCRGGRRPGRAGQEDDGQGCERGGQGGGEHDLGEAGPPAPAAMAARHGARRPAVSAGRWRPG